MRTIETAWSKKTKKEKRMLFESNMTFAYTLLWSQRPSRSFLAIDETTQNGRAAYMLVKGRDALIYDGKQENKKEDTRPKKGR